MKTVAGEGAVLQVLLVEDSPGDVRLTQEAFREVNATIKLHVAWDGVEAMAFLRHEGAYADAPRPDLILLDLNMPRMDGREVLAEIKADERLRCIPVLVLTTSKSDDDILTAYRLHASCFITKPVDLAEFFEVVRSIDNFWLSVVKLPPAGCEASVRN